MGRERGRALPAELLSAVFDYLELAELLSLMVVNRQWMSVVLGHRTYWQLHILSSTSEKAMAYFVLRLDRSGGRPVTISIMQQASSASIAALILPAVAAHLHHTTQLALQLHSDYFSAALDALRRPAPLLEFFMLDFDNDHILPVLPSDIFQGIAPSLKTCILWSVSFSDPIPPALKEIETLECGLRDTNRSLQQHRLAPAFPRLRHVMLRNSFSWGTDLPRWPVKWQRLDWLLLALGPKLVKDALASIPLAGIKGVVLNRLPRDMMPFFLQDVPGDLELSFMETPIDHPSFRMFFESTETGFVRGLIIRSPAKFVAGKRSAYYLLMDHQLALRITRLKLPIGLWRSIARFLPAVNALTSLEIIIYNHGDVSGIGGIDMLLCPRLQSLTFRSTPNMPYIATRELESFAREALRGLCYPIALKLENVLLEGDEDWIIPYFQPIVVKTISMPIYSYPVW